MNFYSIKKTSARGGLRKHLLEDTSLYKLLRIRKICWDATSEVHSIDLERLGDFCTVIGRQKTRLESLQEVKIYVRSSIPLPLYHMYHQSPTLDHWREAPRCKIGIASLSR